MAIGEIRCLYLQNHGVHCAAGSIITPGEHHAEPRAVRSRACSLAGGEYSESYFMRPVIVRKAAL
jgi:hypothetical protein